MNAATPEIQNLARRLIAMEAARLGNDAGEETTRACDRLRGPLAKLAGMAGFRSLMARALALAKAEAPWLESVNVRSDGTLEGFSEASNRTDAPRGMESGTAIVAHLLALLVTFIGEPLMLRLVRDSWPDAATDRIHLRPEGQS